MMKSFISEGNILIGPDPVFEPAEGGLGYELFTALKLHKGKIAQHILNTGETLSYEELLRRSVRIAQYLTKKNLKTTDVICLCAGNNTNNLGILFGAKYVNVNFAAMEPSLPLEDIIYLINLLEPKILFVSEPAIMKIEKALEQVNVQFEIISLGLESSKYATIYDLYSLIEGEENYKPVFVKNIKDTACIFLSSGTSGKPKAVCLNHYALLAQIYILASQFYRVGNFRLSNLNENFSSGEHSLMHFAPPYWISGFLFNLMCIFNGGSCIISTAFDAATAWNGLEKYQPNAIILPPGQAAELCAYGASKAPNMGVSVLAIGGGVATSTHMKELKKCFPNTKVTQIYGQTENSGSLSLFDVNNPEEMEYQEKHPSSCGRPVNASKIRVVEIEAERVCGPGEYGELRIKNKYLMNNYYKMDSSFVFDSEGWFKTGDLVYFDENGYIFFMDRIKDLLLYTVHNISPSIIENVLKQHPAVLECCVIGKPHMTDNEHPMGVVVLKDENKGKTTIDDIVSFVNERVPDDRYKLRAGVVFVNKMLKTKTGKLNKLEMKHRIREGLSF